MLDIKKLRDDFNRTSELIARRKKSYDLNAFNQIDKRRREVISRLENLKNKKNEASREFGRLKAQKQDVTNISNNIRLISSEIEKLEPELNVLDDKLKNFLLSVPNIPHETVPIGDSDQDNLEIKKIGEPTRFNFEPKAHWEIGENLNILDATRAAKITGTRFMIYKDCAAKLERAIVNLMLDTHTSKHGYVEILPPFMVNKESMFGTGQLPKFEEDAFKICNSNYFLVPTAEVPVTNIYRDEILDGSKLPIKYCAYTACFRAEAGSAGRDTRGLIRQHQFNKVELVKFTRPEDSYQELEKLLSDAEDILNILELPYRVVKLCTGDLGFSSAMTYDIEVWMPSYNRYVEISSCSNFEDFQARRANIKFKDNTKDKARFVHTLNGSGLAAGRTTAAVIENYQTSEGKIKVPRALAKYLDGLELIG